MSDMGTGQDLEVLISKGRYISGMLELPILVGTEQQKLFLGGCTHPSRSDPLNVWEWTVAGYRIEWFNPIQQPAPMTSDDLSKYNQDHSDYNHFNTNDLPISHFLAFSGTPFWIPIEPGTWPQELLHGSVKLGRCSAFFAGWTHWEVPGLLCLTTTMAIWM